MLNGVHGHVGNAVHLVVVEHKGVLEVTVFLFVQMLCMIKKLSVDHAVIPAVLVGL